MAAEPSVEHQPAKRAARLQAMYAARLAAAGIQQCRDAEPKRLRARPTRHAGGPDSPEWDVKLSRVLRGVQAGSGGRRAEREARSPQADAAPQAPPVQNIADNFSTPTLARVLDGYEGNFESLQRRWRLMRLNQAGTTTYARDSRVCQCCRDIRTENGLVGLEADGLGRSDVTGLVHCESWSACARCAAKIAYETAQRIQRTLAYADRHGHTVALFTVTTQHHRGNTLHELLTAETKAWNGVTSGSRWAGDSDAVYAAKIERYERALANGFRRSRRRARPERRVGLRAEFGVLGWFRAFEAVFGLENGWHPHFHILLILEGQVPADRVQQLGGRMFERWKEELADEGYNVERKGVDMRVTVGSAVDRDLARYLAKSMSLEVTHGHVKSGSNGRRSPFELLEAYGDTGDPVALAAWREWEQATFKRRHYAASKGWAELEKAAARDDQAEEEPPLEVGAYIDGDGWKAVRPEAVELLIAGRVGGLLGMLAWLNQRGVGYLLTDAGQRQLGGDTAAAARAAPG